LFKVQKNLHTEIAQLKNFGYSIQESYSLPIGLRKFHINQIIERLEREKEEMSKSK
jgi:hypothetical protein